jgi:hypothetical protein
LGMGEGKVRYRTSSLPKNRSGSGEVISAGTFLGSSLPIIVCWLRELNFHWYKVRGGLFLHPGEEEDACPHFLVIENAAGTSLPFDVRAERKTFFSSLNLAQAIATGFRHRDKGESLFPVSRNHTENCEGR